MHSSMPHGSESGFTLIELMITIAIFAVLTAIAMPNLSSLVRSQRIKTATNEIYATLIFARSEAIKRNTTIGICATGDWAAGWAIKATDCTGTVIKQQDAISGVSILRMDGSTAVGDLTFQRDGRLNATPPAGGLVVKAADDSATKAHCVTLDVSGRPHIKTDTDNDSTNGC